MGKPIIGIVGNILIEQGGMFPGYERSYANSDYVVSTVKAGGVPLIFPIVNEDEIIKKQVETVDGIIITGGYDVDPLLYKEEPTNKQGFTLRERDYFDIAVVNYAIQLRKPILGICRGIQILNVAFGGTLYQDISDIEGAYIKHNQSSKPDFPGHSVKIEKGTKLFDILGEKVITNSFHHQAVKDVAKGFIVTAVAADGVIEGIEKEDEEFVVGVQWHPEMMAARENTEMLKIFQKLVYYSKNNRG